SLRAASHRQQAHRQGQPRRNARQHRLQHPVASPMVLSDRFSGDPNQSLLKRTAIYVLGFGLGALALVTVVGFTVVSIAEGVLPDDDPQGEVEEGTQVNVIGDSPGKKPDSFKPFGEKGASKGRRTRGNEAPTAPAEDPI